MTGPVVVIVLCLLLAAALAAVLLRHHAPQDGLVPWLRETFDAWRSGRVQLADMTFGEPAHDGENLRVSDILRMGETGPAYHEPVDLRVVVDRVRSGR